MGLVDKDSSLYKTILSQFQITIDQLTPSRELIQKATRQVMENPNCSLYLIEEIEKNITSTDSKDKMALFFLLDSIAQNAAKLKKTNIVTKIGDVIKHRLHSIISSTDKEDNLPKIEKSVTIWKARDIFSTDIIRSVLLIVENSKIPPPSENEIILGKIEEIRRRQKQEQLLNCLRPADDTPFGELDEMMDRIDKYHQYCKQYYESYNNYNVQNQAPIPTQVNTVNDAYNPQQDYYTYNNKPDHKTNNYPQNYYKNKEYNYDGYVHPVEPTYPSSHQPSNHYNTQQSNYRSHDYPRNDYNPTTITDKHSDKSFVPFDKNYKSRYSSKTTHYSNERTKPYYKTKQSKKPTKYTKGISKSKHNESPWDVPLPSKKRFK